MTDPYRAAILKAIRRRRVTFDPHAAGRMAKLLDRARTWELLGQAYVVASPKRGGGVRYTQHEPRRLFGFGGPWWAKRVLQPERSAFNEACATAGPGPSRSGSV